MVVYGIYPMNTFITLMVVSITIAIIVIVYMMIMLVLNFTPSLTYHLPRAFGGQKVLLQILLGQEDKQAA
tara:strand:+ start:463 stop:672 length:210 start_codon:yes stop_codon:yes gene_type:complete